MRDPEAFADMVVMTVKSALAPILERLAVSEQCNREMQARLAEFSGLRDRVTTIEVKSQIPVEVPEPVDLTPTMERIAAVESALEFRLTALGGLPERLSQVETKAMQAAPVVVDQPAPVDLTPILERVAATEARIAAIGDVRERLAVVETALETNAAAPPDTSVADRVAAVEARLSAAELRAELKAGETAPILSSIADLTKDIGAMRERVAVVEVRAQIPGPAGKDGHAGKDGQDGKDGVDGFGFDDLSVDFDEDRTVSLKFQQGDRVKTFPIKFPVMRQQGVFIEGKSYTRGDVATWAGSQWYCEADTTTKPGEGSKAWTLIVKRGRDGKDGRDGRDLAPVVKS